jgi:MFS family permease
MDTLWDPLTALFDVVGEGFDVVFALVASLASVFALTAGLVALFFGRKLFWVFIGAAGFILGLNVAPTILEWLPASLEPLNWLFMLAIALAVGGLAIVLQRLASVLAGSLLIGLLAYMVAGSYEWGQTLQWVAAIGFGIAGAMLLYFLFDWTLIIVTALIGSVVSLLGVSSFAQMPEAVHLWAFIILAVMGMWYQVRDMQSEKARSRGLQASPLPPGKATSTPAALPPAQKSAPAQAPLPPQAQSAWPAAAQRPTKARPPVAPAPDPRAFQSSPQAWG